VHQLHKSRSRASNPLEILKGVLLTPIRVRPAHTQQTTALKAKKHGKKKHQPRPYSLSGFRSVHSTSWLLILVVLFFASVRFRLRDVPLERDEGEYAYSGQLMLEGIPPYQFAYNMKLPGTYAAYAVIMAIFGKTSGGIHTGLLLLNAATTLLVFALGRKLFGAFAGAFAGMTYAALSASPVLFGLAGHANHFVVFAAVSGILLLLYAIEKDRLVLFFSSGTCLGLAFLMKQPGIVFAIFAILYVIYPEWRTPFDWQCLLSRGGTLLAGVVWPYALTCLILYWAGVFSQFWFWTFSYARTYAVSVPFGLGMHMLRSISSQIFHLSSVVWLICLGGLVSLFWIRHSRSDRLFMIGLLVLSFLGVSVGLYFRNHYFILLLPAASLLGGIAVADGTQVLRDRQFGAAVRSIPAAVFIVAIVISVVQERMFLLAPNPIVACQRMYRNNPFVEALEIGEFLKAAAPRTARIAIFGSEPEIYFYSQLRSATGYIYTYSLMEEQPFAPQMQQEMIREVSASHPEYLVFVDDDLSWLWQRGSAREEFFHWIQNYINSQYVKAAQVDIAGSPGHVLDRARIYVFRRKVH
jgi:hypothetical protein